MIMNEKTTHLKHEKEKAGQQYRHRLAPINKTLTNLPSTRNDANCPELVSMTAIIPLTLSGNIFQNAPIQLNVTEMNPTILPLSVLSNEQ